MEVHHHSNTSSVDSRGAHRKKWTHYVWEFLMLFLAVFCGFLAENFREHQMEHKRERQYMQSLLTDIKEDTVEIHSSKQTALKCVAYEDSLMFFIYNNPPKDFLPHHFLDLDFYAMLRLKTVLNEGTAMQLKNSGNMRLIRKASVFEKISQYWNEQENTRISLGRYMEYRNRGRQFSEKLFVYSDEDLIDAKLIAPSPKGVRVIQSNPDWWAEYSNIISHCHVTALNQVEQLEKLNTEAKELITLLEKEYHLD